MADTKISDLQNYTPIKDGIKIVANVEGKTKTILTDDIAVYVNDDVLGNLVAGRGITITNGTVEHTKEIAVDLDTSLYVVCETLPTTGISTSKVYLTPNSDNGYTEWAYVNGGWEKFGDHEAVSVDLSAYVKTADFETFKTTNTAAIADAKKAGTDADAKAVANASEVSTLKNKVSALETTVGGATSGLVKDVADLKTTVATNKNSADATQTALDAYKKSNDEAVADLAEKVAGAATDANITALTNKVSANETAIAALQTESAKHATTDALDEQKTALQTLINKKADTTALDNYVTKEVYDAHLTDVDEKLADKVEQADINDFVDNTTLTAKLATKADKTAIENFVTASTVDTKIAALDLTNKLAAKADAADVTTLSQTVTGHTTALASKIEVTDLAPYAKTADVTAQIEEAIASVDVTDQLANYATKASVTAVETAYKAADTDLDNRLTLVEALIDKVALLEAKLADYDARFERTGDAGSSVWGKEFLVID